MADIRESFPTLEDASGVGAALAKMLQGDSPAAKNGLIGFSFRDSSGNVILPQLTSDGKIPVDTEALGGTCRNAKGEHAGSATLVDISGCVVSITGSNAANKILADVSCLRTALFQIVYVDDADGTPAETVLAEAVVGPGQYSFKMGGDCLTQDVSGGTGTQKIKLKGKNLGSTTSTMRSTVWCNDSAGS
jgi:hypothetical protein